MNEITVKIHAIAEDGLPDMDELVGRVALIWDGHIIDGWPLHEDEDVAELDEDGRVLWESDGDVGHNQPLHGVTHWVEFPRPIWELEKP